MPPFAGLASIPFAWSIGWIIGHLPGVQILEKPGADYYLWEASAWFVLLYLLMWPIPNCIIAYKQRR